MPRDQVMHALSTHFPTSFYYHWLISLFWLKIWLLKLIKYESHSLALKDKLYLQNWGEEHNGIFFFRTVIILRLRPLTYFSISFIYTFCHALVFAIRVSENYRHKCIETFPSLFPKWQFKKKREKEMNEGIFMYLNIIVKKYIKSSFKDLSGTGLKKKKKQSSF